MAYVLADNILSPLGDTSEKNYLAVKTGKSGIRAYAPKSHGIPEGFMGSLVDQNFEALVLESVKKALSDSKVDVTREDVVFILSTTKGPIERLGQGPDENLYLGEVAQKLASQLGIHSQPIVVCNACISGLSALILATRLLDTGKYHFAVVCGCDCPSRFIISGFQSLKALSTEPCRPFDMERFGLNLGGAAATLVLGKDIPSTRNREDIWCLGRGFVRNDAYHISAPSKVSEGLYKALSETMLGLDNENLAFINAHGTATLFNDQMESVAIQRAELSKVPVNALKGYFGHTLGAAGVLETILSMKAVDDHNIIGTKGFEELGVSGKINISSENRPTDKKAFVKMLSGFGGCNATILAEKEGYPSHIEEGRNEIIPLVKKHGIKISPEGIELDGQPLLINEETDSGLLTAVYKQSIKDYPKYYKMDGLCRLGFVASELLLQAEDRERFVECDDRAIVIFNRSSSISSDKKYLDSIQDADNYFPSPSVFVYTLPNIVTGEIAIRNLYHGETSFYILPLKDRMQMNMVLETVFVDSKTNSALTGWLDYENEDHFEAELFLVEKKH